jgi:hypothetical protein
MSSLILATAFIIVGAGAFLAGWRGVCVGRDVSKQKGPNTLIHYPAPIPWLRTKVSSARWVSWIGRLYTTVGLLLISLGVNNLLNHSVDPKLEPCIALLDAIDSESMIHTPITRRTNPKHQLGCQIAVFDAEQVVWLTVSSTPADSLIGDNFGHQTQELLRKGFDLTPLEISERRSVLARPPTLGSDGPVLIVEDINECSTIDFNPNVASEALIQDTISALRSKQEGKLSSGM